MRQTSVNPGDNQTKTSTSPKEARFPSFLFLAATFTCLTSAVLVFTAYSRWLWPLLGLSAALAFRTAGTYRQPRLARLAVGLLLLIPLGYKSATFAHYHLMLKRDTETVLRLVTKEETLLKLTPKLKKLSAGLQNLHLPDPANLNQFASEVHVIDLAPSAPIPHLTLESVAVQLADIPISREAQSLASAKLNLWRPFLDQVAYFEHAKVYLIDGRFIGKGYSLFEGEVGFAALARMKSGLWQSIKATQTVRWKQRPIGDNTIDEPEWLISSWETREMHSAASPKLLFAETLNQALPNPADLQRARRSLHHEASIRYYLGGAKNLPDRYFATISANQKPGLSVVDINNDGFDDLYITVRIGKNQLLLNHGDGTFEEAAARFGLDLPGNSTCAIFADFDNDGDPDLMLGRSVERTLYLENSEGKFTPNEALQLPYLAISAAAADYNRDGLLDIYISTYRPKVLAGAGKSGADDSATSAWPDEFLPPDQAQEYYKRHSEANDDSELFSNFLNQIGPPNVLYVNRGQGHFEVAPESSPLQLWRNSLQATWADYDEDGDPDLYVANDWAKDALFRNDGDAGFADVTDSVGANEFGFAMGVTWGDYDQDGRQDLYVSTMFSKAGTRITREIEGLDPTYAESASGNYLYRQLENNRFDLMSGHKPGALAVAKAGWSWGGQFADIDNDSFLDLYVLAGYFTAPKEVASELDL